MFMFLINSLSYFCFFLAFSSWIVLAWRRINSDYRRFWKVLVLLIGPSFSRLYSLINVWLNFFVAKWFIRLLILLVYGYDRLSFFSVKLFWNMIHLNFFFGFQKTRLNVRIKGLLFSFIFRFIVKLNWLGYLKELVF